MRFSIVPALLAAAMFSLPVLAIDPAPAQADTSVRVTGKVNVRAGARVRVRPRRRVVRRNYRHYRATPHRSYRLHVGGSLYWGGGIYVGPRYYAEPPPPPPPECDCDHGYYNEPPPPPPRRYAPPPRPVATVAAAPAQPPLPRLGLGVFAGAVDIDGRVEGEELGVLGRLRLTNRLFVEGELAKSELSDGSVDRRAGGALLFDFSPRSRFSLNLLGGVGVSQTDTGVELIEQGYGELGLGLTYRPTQRFHIAADVRGGVLQPIETEAMKAANPDEDIEEPFTRARLSALVYF